MFTKGFSKALIVSVLIFGLLFLMPGSGVGGEAAAAPDGAVLNDGVALSRGNEWFVSAAGTGTDCSRANPGPLEYCVEVKAGENDTVYVGEGFYQATGVDDELISIGKSLHLVGSCSWEATGPVLCYPQNDPPSPGTSYLDGIGHQRVITIMGSGISVTIEGFYIYNGNADHKSPRPVGSIGAGGGIFAAVMDELVLKNNYIWSNSASSIGVPGDLSFGGGAYIDNIKSVDIRENTFVFNSASPPASTYSGKGGGMYVSNCGDGGQVNITSNAITGNMVGNTTTSTGAGAYLSSVKNLYMAHNMIAYNNAIHDHWIDGSALVLSINMTESKIDHNLFYMNYGNSTIDVEGLYGSLARNIFWDNEASYDLYIQHGNEIKITNNFFGKDWTRPPSLSGEPQSTRGGISVGINLAKGCGSPDVDIINNTFALDEYAIRVDGDLDVSIKRNIFTEFTIEAIHIYNPPNDNVVVKRNLFWHNVSNGEAGTNYYVADPKLVDIANGDFHLMKGSPAIDKVPLGVVTSDIDYQPRPIGAGVDLGADEYGTTIFMPLVNR